TLLLSPRISFPWFASEAEREGLEAPDRGSRLPRHLGGRDRQPQVGEPLEQRGQRHLQLDACQMRAEAEVRAVAEAEMHDVASLDVEAVGMWELRLVVV